MIVIRSVAVVCMTFAIVAGLAIPMVPEPKSMFEFPLIPGLGESARLMFFHVPLAWTSVVAFFLALFYGICYLRTDDLRYDLRADAAAGLGVLFCVLATITGSFWAKVTWGSFWNWDPRETSIVILLLLYAVYYVLRSSVPSVERRARLSAVYVVFSGMVAPFFIFVMPRLTSGLHPGAKGDESGSLPLVQLHLTDSMKVVFFISLVAFTCLFLWLFSLRVRITTLSKMFNRK